MTGEPNQPRVLHFGPAAEKLISMMPEVQPVEAGHLHVGQVGHVGQDYGPAEPSTESRTAIELRDWWMGVAANEIEPMLAKMEEYGGMGRAIDLEEIGRGLVHSGVNIPDTYPAAAFEKGETALHQELGIYFYLLGKFARWTAAVAEGRAVSDDTLHDIGIYVRMAQRVRAVGGWPT